ncbi:MAG: hypothetical protein NVSMB64_22930 [Candidatus Velthaea sp.]
MRLANQLPEFRTSDRGDRIKGTYAIWPQWAERPTTPAAAYASQWYALNAKFLTIFDVIRPGGRVVFIIGQGHEYPLREFVQSIHHAIAFMR